MSTSITPTGSLEALESLQERSLIENERLLVETGSGNLTQKPVIMEYVTEHFIQTIEQEIKCCFF